MSRGIKFRAYQKTPSLNHKPGLYEVTGLDFYEGDYGGGEVCLRNKKGEQWTEYIKDVVLEQCTGLKDKDGKEIYEGDIANLEYYEKPFGKKRWHKTYPHNGGKDINVVGFEDGYFKFHEEDKDGFCSELSFSDYGEWESKDVAYKYVAEVIGNIHENPELIGGE